MEVGQKSSGDNRHSFTILIGDEDKTEQNGSEERQRQTSTIFVDDKNETEDDNLPCSPSSSSPKTTEADEINHPADEVTTTKMDEMSIYANGERDESSSSSANVGKKVTLPLIDEREKEEASSSSSSSSSFASVEEKQKASSSSSSSSPLKSDEFGRRKDVQSVKQQNATASSASSAAANELDRKQKISSLSPEENKKKSSSSSLSSSSSAVTEEKKKCSSSSSSSPPDESLDPKVSRWLKNLKWRAELETMSVLYAKSVLPSNKAKNEPTIAQQQKTVLTIRNRPISMSKSDVCDRQPLKMTMAKSHHAIVASAVGSISSTAMRPKHQDKFKHDQFHSHHRSTVCLSSSAISPSLVMNRQSIVIVPAGEECTDVEELPTFSKSVATDSVGGGTLTKFALSLPNDASLGERLAAQRREWTPPLARRPETATVGHRVPSSMTMDYAELPLCEPTAAGGNEYQPRIKYRRNRKSGSSVAITSVGAGHALSNQRRKSYFSNTDSSPLRNGGLAVRPVAFRHSIRVNEQEGSSGVGNRSFGNFSLPPSMPMSSLFCSSANKFTEDESPYEEGTTGSSSLDSGQCSGSSPPFFNNCPSANASSSTAALLHLHQPSPLLQRYSHCWHQQQHKRRCSDEATSSEGGTSSVEIAAKFGSIEHGGRSGTKMPSYARTANCIAKVLRLSSIIFAQLGSTSSEHRRFNGTKKLLNSTNAYIRFLSECPCAAQMPQSEMELVRRAIQDAEGELLRYDIVQPNDYLGVCVRRMLEQTLLVFVRLISYYLSECTTHDQLLLIALEQFVHLLLFGDELCLEAIRYKCMDNLLALALVPLTGSDTLKLLLRTMSVLCGTAKGCIQLLSIGGLDLIMRLLRDSSHADCSIEAAGCLAQLCSPAHCFLRLSPHSLQPLVPRLLKLVDRSPSPEALLLCLAALANLSAHCAGPAAELLYTHNAVLRLVKAAGRENSYGNLFVQEELVTIFTRMANRGFERALVAQGAIPTLCRLLQLEAAECQSQRQSDFQRRVSYKAAVCLGILASTGSGLKSLYEHEVHKVLAKIVHSVGVPSSSSSNFGMALSMSVATAPPIQLICASISQRLQHTYQLETAV